MAETETEATAPDEPSAQERLISAAKREPEKKRGFLSSLWSRKITTGAPAEKPASAIPTLAEKAAARVVRYSLADETLPGVRDQSELFEISRKSGLDDDSDIDVYENDGSYGVAAVSAPIVTPGPCMSMSVPNATGTGVAASAIYSSGDPCYTRYG